MAKSIAKAVWEDEDEEEEARSVGGSQNTRQQIPQDVIMMSMVLKRPILSARNPGPQRPKNDAALRMAISWYPNADSLLLVESDPMPIERAQEVRYVTGTKRPHSMQNTPAVVIAKSSWLKIRKSGQMLPPVFGGRRERMRKLATISRSRKMKPTTRIAHR